MNTCDADTDIAVRYLALDQSKLVATEAALTALHNPGGLTRIIYSANEMKVIAYSNREFTQEKAIHMAQQLGLDIKKSWIMTTRDLVERRIQDDGTALCAPRFHFSSLCK